MRGLAKVYGEHSLSHMIIVDRIFDAAPRPFVGEDATPPTPSPPPANAAMAVATNDDNVVIPAPAAAPPRKMTREYVSYLRGLHILHAQRGRQGE